MNNKNYTIDIHGSGTLEEIVVHLKSLVEGLEIDNMELVLEAANEINETEIYSTEVMVVDMKIL